jgi:hypothetical protein
MNRELSRRLSRLEGLSHADRLKYTVSDRALSDEDWLASQNGDWVEGPEELSPLLTEAEWVARYSAPASQGALHG